MTRDELIATFVRRRAKDTMLTWPQFAGAVGSATPDIRSQILLAVNKDDKNALNSILMGIAKDKKIELATTEVNSLVADNNLTIDELLTLIG